MRNYLKDIMVKAYPGYYLQKAEINDYNVMVHEQSFMQDLQRT